MALKKGAVQSIIKYLGAPALSIFLMYWVFRKFEWQEFRAKIDEVDYFWVYLSMVLSFSSYIARAYRWTLLINPLGYQLKTWRALIAVFIGYMANLVLPRLGEVSRCAILKKNDNIPVPLSIGTVVTERVFDLIIFAGLFVITLALEFDLLVAFFSRLMENTPDFRLYFYIFLGVFGLAGLLGLVYRKTIVAAFHKLPFADKVKGIGQQLWDGFLSFKKVEKKVGFIVSTLVIWLAYYLMTYVIIFSIAETSSLGIVAGLSLLAGAGVAMIIPVQGGFGTYHAIISLLLTFYGIDELVGTFFATLLHTSQVVTQVVAGITCLLITFFLTKRANDRNSKKDQESSGFTSGGQRVETAG
ncbi:MAG: lysylphosphatidylglycerol synthase transmembrane domain-containing protein [Bacteroidota bacterium]